MRHERRLSRPGHFLVVVFLILVASVPGLSSSFLPSAQAQDDSTCAANEFQVLGQEWEVAGGAFGFTAAQPPNADTVAYDMLAQQFSQMTLGSGSAIAPDRQVVILIVDDFDTPVRTLSHGEYVIEVASDMLGAARADVGFAEEMILVDKVEVTYDDVSVIISRIDDALRARIEDGYTHFVLNMSFALMPCMYEVEAGRHNLPDNVTLFWQAFMEVYENPERPKNYSLIQYVENALLTQGNVPDSVPEDIPFEESDSIARAVARAVVFDWIGTESTLLDPLRAYLQGGLPEGVEVLVPVASAGNYGGYTPPYDPDGNGFVDPFAPGSWPEVISVSSTRADFSQLSVFSNAGGISAPGEWHEIASSSEYVAGTSFAAPVTSVLVALMQSTSAVTCNFAPWEQAELLNAYLIDAWNDTPPFSAACAP